MMHCPPFPRLLLQTCRSLIPPKVPENENRIQHSYSFWFTQRTRGSVSTPGDYEDNIKHLGSFSSVEQFWSHYCHLARPSELPPHSDIHIFKMGIKPMWEVCCMVPTVAMVTTNYLITMVTVSMHFAVRPVRMTLMWREESG